MRINRLPLTRRNFLSPVAPIPPHLPTEFEAAAGLIAFATIWATLVYVFSYLNN